MVDDALLALDDEERLEKRRSYQCPRMLLYFSFKKGFSNQRIWQSDKVISIFKFFKFGVKHLEGLSASLFSEVAQFYVLSSFGKLHYRHSNSAGLSPFWSLRNGVP